MGPKKIDVTWQVILSQHTGQLGESEGTENSKKKLVYLCLMKLHTDWGIWSASRPGRFTPVERDPDTHWIGGWVDPRACLDDVEKRKFFTLLGLELRPLGRSTHGQSLYRLRHCGSWCRGNTSIRQRQLPSRSFSIHHSSINPALATV
jgi:hypothetical protein